MRVPFVRTSFCGKDDGTMPGSRYDASMRPRRSGWSASTPGLPDAVGSDHSGLGPAGMSAETLRKRIRQAEVDEGARVSGAESAEIRELRRNPLPDLRGT